MYMDLHLFNFIVIMFKSVDVVSIFVVCDVSIQLMCVIYIN